METRKLLNCFLAVVLGKKGSSEPCYHVFLELEAGEESKQVKVPVSFAHSYHQSIVCICSVSVLSIKQINYNT